VVDIKAISSGLQLGEDGVWYSSTSRSISYPSKGNEFCFAAEDYSFWFLHRNICIVSVVNSFPPPDNGTIFDIGGGNGFVSLGLSSAGFDVALVEPGPIGASNAKKRGIENVICATTEAAQFRQRSLSAVGLFDVIEHIDDDISFLQSIRVLIKHGGLLYATVPAFSFLWSEEDVLAGHFRRYTLSSISNVLKSSGFEMVFASYIFRFLPVPIFLLRTLPFKIGLSRRQLAPTTVLHDHTVKGALPARIMNAILKPEIENLKNKRTMSFGGSCLIVATCR
jgi:2-polyprenyl-3-methyl-5-hydroxy-6-metoxy-1,4-benzoquinol methylase